MLNEWRDLRSSLIILRLLPQANSEPRSRQHSWDLSKGEDGQTPAIAFFLTVTLTMEIIPLNYDLLEDPGEFKRNSRYWNDEEPSLPLSPLGTF